MHNESKQPLSVLQLIDSLNTGGAEMMAVQTANALADYGVESHLCVTRLEGELKPLIAKDVSYLFIKKKKLIDLNALRNLKHYISQNHINIIHAHSNSYFLACLIKIALPEIKILWHNHTGNNVNLTGYKLIALKIFSSYFNGIINVNKNLTLWALYKFPHIKSIYLSNFPVLNSLKNTLLNGKSGEKIVMVAGYRMEKDHLNLLKAFKIVLNTHSDCTLHLVGQKYNDTYTCQVDNFIQQENLYNSVFQYGSRQDIAHILSQATIGVLSSQSEGLPVTLLEYGLAGLPVAVTAVGECPSVLEQGKNGILVPPKEAEALAEGLLYLIEHETERSIFALNLQKHVLERYSKEQYIHQLLNFYADIR